MLFFSWKAAHQFWCLFQKTLWFFFTSYSLCTSQLALCNSWGRRDQRHAVWKEEGKHEQPVELGAALCEQKRRARDVRSAWGCSPQAWSRAGSAAPSPRCQLCWVPRPASGPSAVGEFPTFWPRLFLQAFLGPCSLFLPLSQAHRATVPPGDTVHPTGCCWAPCVLGALGALGGHPSLPPWGWGPLSLMWSRM